jgi:hypothetical protein
LKNGFFVILNEVKDLEVINLTIFFASRRMINSHFGQFFNSLLGDAVSGRVRQRRNYALMGELWDHLFIPSPPLGGRGRVRGN